MADIIQILPDNVANQIAAGEVVQRPASVVKELMENSIDAGAGNIKLIIKDAGKTLVQIIDNGCGMSETDARMSLERHATSKIKKAADLYAIRTMGFRGEAMASIASIAHLEINTKMHDADLGTKLIVEGSKVIEQSPCQCADGTNIAVKNLFFNVPARRNFLKSDNAEMHNIINAFERIALVYPNVAFSFFKDGNEMFNLPQENFKQRIAHLFGKKYEERLVSVEEKTNIVNISGFVLKPDFAKRTNKEQFFFVNQRFIKSNYLNHSVKLAFSELIAVDEYPSFFLKLEIDPSKIEINIHPTKTEIKFEDEKSIYAIIRTAVKQALGKFNIAPSLDFENEQSIHLPYKDKPFVKPPEIKTDPDYNPFKSIKQSENQIKRVSRISQNEAWLKNLETTQEEAAAIFTEKDTMTISSELIERIDPICAQLHNKYILTTIKSGIIIIDQQRAHQRILYEQYLDKIKRNHPSTQQLLFPESIQLSASDFALIQDLKTDIEAMGFDIAFFGGYTLIVNGVPFEMTDFSLAAVFEGFIENYKLQENIGNLSESEKIAKSLAKSLSIKSEKELTQEEMQDLINQLFFCENPRTLPNGKPIIITFDDEELKKRFQ